MLVVNQIKICSNKQEKHGFQVLWHSDDSSESTQELKSLLDMDWEMEPYECGVDVEDKWTDAEEPIGKTIAGLEGWRTERLHSTIIVAVIPGSCVLNKMAYCSYYFQHSP